MRSLSRPLIITLSLFFIFYTSISASSDAESNTNSEVVRAIYASFEAGDMSAALLNMSEDMVWLHPGDPKQIPFAGEFKGRAGVQQFFDIAFSVIDVLEQKIYSIELSGDKAIVLGFEHMRVKKTGKEYQSNWIHLYTLANGKVIKFEEYIDTAALVAAFSEDR